MRFERSWWILNAGAKHISYPTNLSSNYHFFFLPFLILVQSPPPFDIHVFAKYTKVSKFNPPSPTVSFLRNDISSDYQLKGESTNLFISLFVWFKRIVRLLPSWFDPPPNGTIRGKLHDLLKLKREWKAREWSGKRSHRVVGIPGHWV